MRMAGSSAFAWRTRTNWMLMDADSYAEHSGIRRRLNRAAAACRAAPAF